MPKKQKKELTFTFVNKPSKSALEFHVKFMYQKYLEGRFSKVAEKEVS